MSYILSSWCHQIRLDKIRTKHDPHCNNKNNIIFQCEHWAHLFVGCGTNPASAYKHKNYYCNSNFQLIEYKQEASWYFIWMEGLFSKRNKSLLISYYIHSLDYTIYFYSYYDNNKQFIINSLLSNALTSVNYFLGLYRYWWNHQYILKNISV